jgi:3-oxoacyl-[acyl-carrier protein] reductase
MLILVTGSSKGIGFEITKKFASMPGMLVVAVSRNTSSLERLVKEISAHTVLPLKADLNDPEDIKRIYNTLSKIDRPLDILINNAGHIVNKPFEKISARELQQVYSTNVFAPFMLIQKLLPLFNQSSSHIVNISSMGGFQGSAKFPGLTAYSSSKAALSGLTECLAEELKPRNISVNCLALGAVQTEMLQRAFPGYDAPLKAHKMAEFICEFALSGHHFFNGKILPVSSTTP